MSSACNPPTISVPVPPIDIVALAKALLALLPLPPPPQMPTVALPAVYCALD
jgi:hypothetical protein